MYPADPVKGRPGHAERADRLLGLIDRFSGRRVAVIGDVIADEFIYGRISRVSREAPVLILDYDSTDIVPGGGGNAANNVATLGAVAKLVALVGRDEPGRRLVAGFHRGVARPGVVRPLGYRTPTKTRILAGGVHSAKQQVVRIDRATGAVPAAARRALSVAAETAVRQCDAVLIADYGSGLVTPALASRVRRLVRQRQRRRQVPVVIDSRYDLSRYRGFEACTPNEAEVEALLGVTIGDDAVALERAGRDLLGRVAMQAVLVTRGSRGMALFEPRRRTVHIPVFGTDEIADVTGAGDTVIATVAVALACGSSMFEAATLANYAGGLVVMKRGTATVSADELREAVRRDLTRPRL